VTDAAGMYRLVVSDGAAQDTGTLRSWRLDITRCTTNCGGTASTRTFEDTTGGAIPDANPTGLARTLAVDSAGTVSEISVTVDITHPFPADLTIKLAREGGREVVLLTEDYSSTGGIQRTFTPPAFVGDTARGNWRLTVVDGADRDVGRLNRWSLRVTTR